MLAFVLQSCGPSSDADRQDASSSLPVQSLPTEVSTLTVASETLTTIVTAAGSVKARRVSAIGSEVPGRIVSVLADVGDFVEKNDALFEVDPIPYELALSEAQAGLELSRAELKHALSEESRVDRLIEEKATSARIRDERKTQASIAAAQVSRMEARLKRVRAELDRTIVRAPYAGSVVERLAHEGSMAGSGPVIVLQESTELEVTLNVPEAILAPIRVGDLIKVYVPGGIHPIESTISRVNARVDPDTRTIEVRAGLNQGNQMPRPGSFIRAEIFVTPDSPRPTVLKSAILFRDGRAYVFRVEGDSVEQVLVKTGIQTDDRIELLSGAKEGDELVDGKTIERLIDGDAISRTSARVLTARPGTAP